MSKTFYRDTKPMDFPADEALERMGGGIAYGNDIVSPGSKPSHVFMDTAIAKELGWLIHPEMIGTFFDDVWEQLGRAMGRLKYLPDVTVAHLYTERDNLAAYFRDKDIYERWLRHDCEGQAGRCLRALRRSSSTLTASSSKLAVGTAKPSTAPSASTATRQ